MGAPVTRGKIEMEDREIRAALDLHWAASDANDFEVEHQIYREDAVLEYPQSGERIRGRRNIQASRFAQPSRKRFTVRRILGAADLCVADAGSHPTRRWSKQDSNPRSPRTTTRDDRLRSLGGEVLGDERCVRRHIRDIRRRRASFFLDLGEQPGLNRGGRALLLRMIVSETAGLEDYG